MGVVAVAGGSEQAPIRLPAFLVCGGRVWLGLGNSGGKWRQVADAVTSECVVLRRQNKVSFGIR